MDFSESRLSSALSKTEVQISEEVLDIITESGQSEKMTEHDNDSVSLKSDKFLIEESPFDLDSQEWFETVGFFSEVLTNSMLCLQGLTIEFTDSYKMYFNSR